MVLLLSCTYVQEISLIVMSMVEQTGNYRNVLRSDALAYQAYLGLPYKHILMPVTSAIR